MAMSEVDYLNLGSGGINVTPYIGQKIRSSFTNQADPGERGLWVGGIKKISIVPNGENWLSTKSGVPFTLRCVKNNTLDQYDDKPISVGQIIDVSEYWELIGVRTGYQAYWDVYIYE